MYILRDLSNVHEDRHVVRQDYSPLVERLRHHAVNGAHVGAVAAAAPKLEVQRETLQRHAALLV